MCFILVVFADGSDSADTNISSTNDSASDIRNSANLLTNNQFTNSKSQDPDDNTNQRYQTNDLDELLYRTVKTNYDWSINDRDRSEYDTNSITVKFRIKKKIKFTKTLINKPSPLGVKVPDFKKRKSVIYVKKNRLEQERLRKEKLRKRNLFLARQKLRKQKLHLKRLRQLKRYRMLLKRKKLLRRKFRKRRSVKKKRKALPYYSIINRRFKSIKNYYYSNPYYPHKSLRKFLGFYRRYLVYIRRNWRMRKAVTFFIARSRFDLRQYIRAFRLFTWLRNVSRGRERTNFNYWVNVCRRHMR